jgi:hypothetical protein
MSHHDRKRKQARKLRNRLYQQSLLTRGGEPRVRWQGSVSLQFGRHPDAVIRFTWSGVQIPVDLADPNHMDGVAELTELALQGKDAEVN